MYCKECGNKFKNEKAVVCVHCGTNKGQGNNYCSECGTEVKNKEGAEVCLNCGCKLKNSKINISNSLKGSNGTGKPIGNSKVVAILLEYKHVQLCRVCGKEGQSYREKVNTFTSSSYTVDFCNSGIPVGWVSSYTGVYCSEECHKQSIIEKEKENA